MEQTKGHSEGELHEECQEDVTSGEVAEGQDQGGGEASIEDSRSYRHHSLDCPLLT